MLNIRAEGCTRFDQCIDKKGANSEEVIPVGGDEEGVHYFFWIDAKVLGLEGDDRDERIKKLHSENLSLFLAEHGQKPTLVDIISKEFAIVGITQLVSDEVGEVFGGVVFGL